MSSKFNVGRFAPFVAASLSLFLYWAALPPSWVGWAVFFVPAVWAATVFNADFNRSTWRNGENAATGGDGENKEGGKKRRLGRIRGFARFVGRVFFGGEYRQYWTASFCFWAATVVWISYPHPATTLGWLAASAYLAIYFPLFVAITRALSGGRAGRISADAAQDVEVAKISETGRNAAGLTANRPTARRFEIPLWLAAPIAWTAVEWLRNRGLGGFSFAGLSHSLYDFPQFIQIAEPFGEYGVGAAIVAIGTLLGTAFSAAFSAGNAKEANEALETNGGDLAVAESCVKRRSFDGAKWRRVAFSLVGAVAIFGVVVGFGVRRLAFFDAAERSALDAGAVPCRVALLQDGTTYRFPVPDYQNRQVEETYLALAAEAARSETPFDVVVWPESCCNVFWDEQTAVKSADSENGANAALGGNGASGEDGINGEDGENSVSVATAEVERIARAEKSRALSQSRRDAARLTNRLGSAAILGTTALLVDVDAGDETTVYNAAVFAPCFDATTVAALGEKYVDFVETPASTAPTDPNAFAFRLYGKRRLVICGEYIPGADLLPDWFPLKAVCADFSLARGSGPVAFPIVRRGGGAENNADKQDEQNKRDKENGQVGQNGQSGRNEQSASSEPLLFAPHICFESSIPHYVKEQVRELTAVGAEPDVLVCLSNDGWFRNGSQTDGHLATQVFRAVENRKPVVAATHGGFSAHVDQAGRVRSRGARRGTEVVAAEVLPVDCVRFGRTALIGGRDLAETLALVCLGLGLGALGVRGVFGAFGRRKNV